MTTYKERFDSSQNRAHDKNIATKILRDMKDLRSKAEESPTVPRRWIWELIQNAKDVAYSEGVKIKVDYYDLLESSVEFQHTGRPFTADNIRFLIEQISTKDRQEDSEGKRPTTGKFGTGFMTTHLLSEIVQVKGVAKEPELEYKQFELQLDRSHYDVDQITDSVHTSKESVSNLDELPNHDNYNALNYNTTFHYPLSDSVSVTIAKKGLTDLEKSLAFAFAFVGEIESIHIAHRGRTYINTDRKNVTAENTVDFFNITVKSPSQPVQRITIAKITSGFTSVALPVEIDDQTVTILPIDKEVPKLFCDFPLIGTEILPFPVIVNNPNFNPTDPRDGIYLTNTQRENKDIDENKAIMQEAVQLYFKLLDHAVAENWQNLHYLAKINALHDAPSWISSSYFNENILKPIRKKLLHAHIVTNANSDLQSILQADGTKYMWFPSASKKEIREEIWRIGGKWFAHVLPEKTEIDLWYNLLWDECGKLTLDKFAEFVESRGSLEELQYVLPNDDAIDWLNDFYKLLVLDEKEYLAIITKRKIVPNQNGDFCKMGQLSQDAGGIDREFKEILEGFDYKIRSKLADENIILDFQDDQFDLNDTVKEIVSQIEEKTNDREIAKHYQKTFDLLLSYFSKNPARSNNLFPSIYKKKHILYDDEKILSNIGKAEQLDDLFTRFNVTTAEELHELLERKTENSPSLLPITEEILASMGINSPEDWAKALEDKNLQQLFAHDSVPSRETFVLAQTLIAQAKKSVMEHLETLEEYDLSQMDDQTAKTVLAGVRKNGQLLDIVFRPAYNNEVIIYYGSERDTLDYMPSELWVDDGLEVRQITLGHIIKVSQIQKFPI